MPLTHQPQIKDFFSSEIYPSHFSTSPEYVVHVQTHSITFSLFVSRDSSDFWNQNPSGSGSDPTRTFSPVFPMFLLFQFRIDWTVHSPVSSDHFSQQGFFFLLSLVLKPLGRLYASRPDLNSLRIWWSTAVSLKKNSLCAHTAQQLVQLELQLGKGSAASGEL